MKPISPVMPNNYSADFPEGTYGGKDYIDLPAVSLYDEWGTVITRWRPSFRDRVRLAFGGTLWLTVLTFKKQLQPVKLQTTEPDKPEAAS